METLISFKPGFLTVLVCCIRMAGTRQASRNREFQRHGGTTEKAPPLLATCLTSAGENREQGLRGRWTVRKETTFQYIKTTAKKETHALFKKPKRYILGHYFPLHVSVQSVAKTYISFPDIIRIFVDISSQSKITDFDHIILRQEDVASRKVSVDTLQKYKT